MRFSRITNESHASPRRSQRSQRRLPAIFGGSAGSARSAVKCRSQITNGHVAALAIALLPFLAACGGGGKGIPASREEEDRAVRSYEEAIGLEAKGKLHDALDRYTKAVAIYGKFALAYDRRARLQEKMGNLSGAESDLSAAIAAAPNEAIYYNNRGQFYRRRERYNEAERDMSHAIALDKAVPEFYMNRARLYLDMGKYEEGLRDCDVLMLFSPTDSRRKEIEMLIHEIKQRQKK